MGKAHPELLIKFYDVPVPDPNTPAGFIILPNQALLVAVIDLATTAARANNIRSKTGDLLGLKKRGYEAEKSQTAREETAQALLARGGRATRRRRGGATSTELETLVQMIFDQIAIKCKSEPEISLQVADAFAILVQSQPGNGDNLVSDYLLGVFNKFLAFKKMADKNPDLHIIADVMFGRMKEPYNHFLVEQKSWLVFKNALKADPKVIAALDAKVKQKKDELAKEKDEKDAAHIRRTAEVYISAIKQLGHRKGDTSPEYKSIKKQYDIAWRKYLGLESMQKGPLAEAAMQAILEEVRKAQNEIDAARDADLAQAERIRTLAEKYDEAELDMPDKSQSGYATAEIEINAILKEYNDEIAKVKTTGGPLARAAVAKAIAESKAKVDALDKHDLESKKRAEALAKAQEEAKAAEEAEAAKAKAREAAAAEAARETEESARRQAILRTPTAEELRINADEEKASNAAAAAATEVRDAEERAARVNASDNQDEVRMGRIDKKAEEAAAKASAAVRAAAAEKSAKLRELAPHVRRRLRRQGGKRRTPKRVRHKLRKSTFRRHRKH
jgi:hypothetical protein